MAGVDFTNLSVGEELKMYEYTENGFAELRSCYPLFYQNSLVALAIDVGNGLYQISTDITSEIDELNLDSVAIVYDNTCAYVYDGERFHLLRQNSTEIEGRLSLSEANVNQYTGNLATASMDSFEPLSYNYTTTTNGNARSDVMATCYIDLVTQLPYANICWAAVIASIVNYREDTSLTAVDVAKGYYGTAFNRILSASTMPSILSNYGVTGYSYRVNDPDVAVMFNNLSRGYPICGVFTHSNGGHVATIFCVHKFDGYIMVMDPELSSFQFCYYTNGNFSYVSSYSGVNLTLAAASCRYWTS